MELLPKEVIYNIYEFEGEYTNKYSYIIKEIIEYIKKIKNRIREEDEIYYYYNDEYGFDEYYNNNFLKYLFGYKILKKRLNK
tara:strand:+ start:165 stop:410 length:246 start_codon:yes stop_codon:yes gene_type:complete